MVGLTCGAHSNSTAVQGNLKLVLRLHFPRPKHALIHFSCIMRMASIEVPM